MSTFTCITREPITAKFKAAEMPTKWTPNSEGLAGPARVKNPESASQRTPLNLHSFNLHLRLSLTNGAGFSISPSNHICELNCSSIHHCGSSSCLPRGAKTYLYCICVQACLCSWLQSRTHKRSLLCCFLAFFCVFVFDSFDLSDQDVSTSCLFWSIHTILILEADFFLPRNLGFRNVPYVFRTLALF